MILADTSIWIDHLRHADQTLTQLLTNNLVLAHPAVVGELALGSIANRQEILGLLANLPQSIPATHDEVLVYIDKHTLPGRGIGYVDAHLLASVALTNGSTLWTRDKRLRAIASSLGTLATHS